VPAPVRCGATQQARPAADVLTGCAALADGYHAVLSWRVTVLVAALFMASLAAGEPARAAKPGSTPSVSAVVVGDGVRLGFAARLLGAPPASAFVVTVDGRVASLESGVAVSGRYVRLSLSAPVYRDDDVKVRYTPPVRRLGGLRTASGRALGGFAIAARNLGPAGCGDPLGERRAGVVGEGPTDTSYFLSPVGRYGLTVVPVDFPDVPAVVPGPAPAPGPPLTAVITPQAPPVMQRSAIGSWINQLSYGRLAIDAATPLPWLRLSKSFAAYGLAPGMSWESARPLVAEALAIADGISDLSTVSVVFIQPRLPSGVTLPFPIQLVAPPGQGIVVDGHEIRHVLLTGVAPASEVPSLLGLMGLPQLAPRVDQVGIWDTTAAGAPGAPRALLAWHARKLGWLDPTQVRCVRAGAADITLDPLWRSGGVKLALAPTSRTSAIAVELRGKQGLDAANCRDGILVYRIDTRIDARPPLAVSPISIVTPLPVTSSRDACGPLHDQVLGAPPDTPSSIVADGTRVEVVSRREDGATTVRITRIG
jgi:hypothetical protein